MKTEKTNFDKKGRLNETKEVLSLRQMRLDYYNCLASALREATDDEQIVRLTAENCRRAGLPEEPCVQRTAQQERITLQEDEVRKLFRVVYMKRPLQPRSALNQKERIARGIEDFFDRRYELRYNTVKKIEEWRPRDGTYHEWQQLTDRDLNRMTFEQMHEGGDGWGIDLQLYLHSSMIPQWNPLTEFLRGCGRWTGLVDHIGALARRVPTDYEDWPQLFHRWFLGMVAQWQGRDRRFGNMLVPMLIGAQGTRKTTFCRMILPPALHDYFIDDIKMDNAEQVERVLGRMALVNIDEYNAKTDREQAKIKRLLTERDVQVRAMRSDQYTMTQRLCSFIATTNDTQPLPGGDGTRRYLCVELTGVIDTDTPINYPRLYAQAMHELDAGEPFRFFPHEEAEMQEHNRPYQQQTSAEEALLAYYAPAERTSKHFIKAIDIQTELAKHLRAEDVPNIKQLTVTLKRCGFRNGAQHSLRGWYAMRRDELV